MYSFTGKNGKRARGLKRRNDRPNPNGFSHSESLWIRKGKREGREGQKRPASLLLFSPFVSPFPCNGEVDCTELSLVEIERICFAWIQLCLLHTENDFDDFYSHYGTDFLFRWPLLTSWWSLALQRMRISTWDITFYPSHSVKKVWKTDKNSIYHQFPHSFFPFFWHLFSFPLMGYSRRTKIWVNALFISLFFHDLSSNSLYFAWSLELSDARESV